MLNLLHFNKNERRKWMVELKAQQSHPHQAFELITLSF